MQMKMSQDCLVICLGIGSEAKAFTLDVYISSFNGILIICKQVDKQM